MRELNFCFKCHEKWTQHHKCRPKLNAMKGEETFVKALDEELAELVPGGGEEEQGEISLNMILGFNQTPKMIRIVGLDKSQPVAMLIASGSTHSFVDPISSKS